MGNNRVSNGFKKFFISKLKKVNYYTSKEEMKSDVDFAIENMEYDMRDNNLSLMSVFDNACRDLHVESDGLELYL